MAGKRMTKADRDECEKNLATCESLAATFRKMLSDDDEEQTAGKAAGDRAIVAGILQRDGVKAAIMAIREMPVRGGSRG
ncbi:MAG TPA: hypothetical protein VNY51_09410 [Candidatus Dormibacteraeota bacterium]|jgi:hypothetical protein|nr:hypothetical protein [Candidatus Dormibacteraeota bacterium]